MTRWLKGRDTIDRLSAEGRLERISGAATDGEHHLISASAALGSARRELEPNPETAYVLAYDAARRAAVGLLAQQGLRAKGPGHHMTTVEVVRAQFGGPFDKLSALRRRRSELEYPLLPGDSPEPQESQLAIEWAEDIINASLLLLPQLGAVTMTEGP